MVDMAEQRKNMVESQVRPSDVTDRRIIRAMLAVPRHAFVSAPMSALAYMDGDVPLRPAGIGDIPRALLSARTFAKLVQAAAIDDTETVLDVGAATGYGAAVLSTLARRVVALESDRELGSTASRVLSHLGTSNVTWVQGDLSMGHAEGGPYNVIILEGAVQRAPTALIGQLANGGRLVAVLTEGGKSSRAVIWHKSNGAIGVTDVFDSSAPVLPGFAATPAFSF